MLLGNQEFKTATSKAPTNTNTAAQTQLPATDAAAIAVATGLAGQQAVTGVAIAVNSDAGGNGKLGSTNTSKVSAHLAGGVTSRDKLDPAATIAAKPDTSTQLGAKELAATTPLKASVVSELPGALAPSAQALAQSASTLLASGMQSTSTANGNVTQATVATPLGSNAWPAEFSQKITWISTQQNQAAELHLNPPGLGPISITINVADNQATAVFTSPHSEVRDAIENAMPKLRESMAENGIMLGNATVSDQAPRDNGSNNFMNQRDNNQSASGRGDFSSDLAPVNLPLAPANRHNGMVDTFA
jgi:flagellar hook-length control protein FliK